MDGQEEERCGIVTDSVGRMGGPGGRGGKEAGAIGRTELGSTRFLPSSAIPCGPRDKRTGARTLARGPRRGARRGRTESLDGET